MPRYDRDNEVLTAVAADHAISQAYLADITGISHSFISRVFSGQYAAPPAVLRAMWEATHDHRVLRIALSDSALDDLHARPTDQRLALALQAAELSDGQRARLGMALAMARVTRGRETLMLIDECCSTLDRVSARCVARTLRRWCSRQGRVRVLCATAHDDLAEAISPDLLLCMEKTEATP